MNLPNGLAELGSALWILGWLLPFQPFRIRETLSAKPNQIRDLADVTALIPARDEAGTIGATLDGLHRQACGLTAIVVDDQSTDETAKIASSHPLSPTVICGTPPPPGWLGKMWALHQGVQSVETRYILLLDADISCSPGVLTALLDKMESENLVAASVMAELRRQTPWERLLAPAYVYFFRLLYPFSLVHSKSYRVAAAAGGCVLLRRETLLAAGGFAAIRDAIIDDCSLARLLKKTDCRIWLGLTRDVGSLRPYATWREFWDLVSRSAFAQLNFSILQLSACTVAMLSLFVGPLLLCFRAPAASGMLGLAGLTAMVGSYVPILRYYDLSPVRCLTLPFVAIGYLAMTWHSAIRYWKGTRTTWKGRTYSSQESMN
jgi:hopene-associated glycosyltransferase HpnB